METTKLIAAVLVWMLLPRSGSSIANCKDAVERGYETNVCHYKTEPSILKCSRNEEILVLKLLQRTETDCNPNGDGCCENKRDDKLYDIGGCLVNESEASRKTVYQSALREVLEECSQRRYCLLESQGTHLRSLMNITLEGRRPSAVLVNHECVKADESVKVCQNQARKGPHVYIGLGQTMTSSAATCTCTVRGGNRVQLLDVRLGEGQSRLFLRDNDNTVLTLGGEDIHFMQTKTIGLSEWSLHLEVDQESRPHSVWMKVEGSGNSTVDVTCSDTQASPSPSSSSEAPTAASPTLALPVQPSPTSNCLTHYLPYVFLILGLASGFLTGVVLAVYVKRILKRSPFKKKPPPPPSVVPGKGRSPEEPVYSLPYNNQGRLIVVRSLKRPRGTFSQGDTNTQPKHSYSSNPTIDKGFVYSKGDAIASSEEKLRTPTYPWSDSCSGSTGP
ncbi:uncharacterized protein LOC124125817 [Haliotis rufescens]|uniref:uncharacterized protein LOC124125817 n=1 Tax=Haliotis rufescens TaxID=6454 RepID=UPI00201EC5F5|nr:uncharacterized protein LOC124125817 [Haliotis rufescens]